MKNLGNSAKGAAGKNPFLGKAQVNDTKKEISVVVLDSGINKDAKKTPKETEDAVIIEEKTTTSTELTVQEITQQKTKELSIDQIIEKADKLQRLNARRTEIKEKLNDVETFEIGHDEENAQLTLTDSKGRVIRTSNPVSIAKVLEDWKVALLNNLKKKEAEILDLAQS